MREKSYGKWKRQCKQIKESGERSDEEKECRNNEKAWKIQC